MKKTRPIKRIGRKRGTLGWTLLTLGLLVAGVWVASGWQQVLVHLGSRSVAVHRGLLDIHQHWGDQALFNKVYVTEPGAHRWQVDWWRWCWRRWNGFVPFDTTTAPLWPVPVLLWTSAASLLRSGILAPRRKVSNACPKCGYLLAGLREESACPECGKARDVQRSTI